MLSDLSGLTLCWWALNQLMKVEIWLSEYISCLSVEWNTELMCSVIKSFKLTDNLGCSLWWCKLQKKNWEGSEKTSLTLWMYWGTCNRYNGSSSTKKSSSLFLCYWNNKCFWDAVFVLVIEIDFKEGIIRLAFRLNSEER